ncbi:MAG TPA: FG-GAP-like repeat-containing protein [Kofleriaceae bacterium]
MKITKWLFTCTCVMACATERAPDMSQTGGTREGAPSWEEFSASPPLTWEAFRASVHRADVAPYPFIVDGDIALYDERALRKHYDAWLADAYADLATTSSALTVRNVMGADVLWSVAQRNNLTYCVSDQFGARKTDVVTAMGRATRSWSNQVAVKFIYRPDQDAACSNANNNVLFNVVPSSSTDFFASSFFPDDSRANRQLLITSDAITTSAGGRDFQGILRHETGHILGFRHEHIHITCTGESTAQSRQVTSYDVNSVMHYPQCRPSGTGGYRQTALDFSGAASLYGHAQRTSDILWRNLDTGLMVIWSMSNATVGASTPLFNEPAEWQVQGTGDFNGDGTSDILWRNLSTGLMAIWTMSGATVAASTELFNEPVEWQVGGIGDFNGDGTSDILWRNTSTGVLVVWTMSGTSVAASTTLPFPQGPETQIQGIGDFNNDGTSDILWRNLNTGLFTIWTMSSATFATSIPLFNEPAEWQVQGIGDFNGDGTSDVLWRNVNTGLFVIWSISNGTVAASTELFAEPAEWQVQRIGDFNSDGTSDVLWRNLNTGLFVIWSMSNATVGGSTDLFAEPPEWQVQGVGDFNGQ